MANHSGTIASDETWAVADNPHIITGNLILNDAVHLTIEAGCNVEYSGYYYTYLRGKITWVGTLANPIHFYSTVALPTWNSANTLQFGTGIGANVLDAGSTMKWCIFENFADIRLRYWSGFDSVPAFDYVVFSNMGALYIDPYGPSGGTTISNVMLDRLEAATYVQIPNGDTLEVKDIHLRLRDRNRYHLYKQAIANNGKLHLHDFIIENGTYWIRDDGGTNAQLTVEDGFVIGPLYGEVLSNPDAIIRRVTMSGCWAGDGIYVNNAAAVLYSSDNDIVSQHDYAIQGGLKTTLESDHDYLAGCRRYDPETVDAVDGATASTMFTGLTANRTLAQATRNRPYTVSGAYTESGITANTATIAFTSNCRCSSWIEYWETAGQVMSTNEKYNDWSGCLQLLEDDKDGNQQTTSHTHNLYNLEPGTTYNYHATMRFPDGTVVDGSDDSFVTSAAAGGGGPQHPPCFDCLGG